MISCGGQERGGGANMQVLIKVLQVEDGIA